MRTLRNALKIAALIVATISFSARAMNAKFFTKNNLTHIAPCNLGGVDTTVYTMVDVAPGFAGGIPAFMEYLSANVKYPAVDKENKITGKVFVAFIVEPDGSLSNVKAMLGPSETMKAEAIRVLANSPKWTPGKVGGKAVRARFTIPINFELPK